MYPSTPLDALSAYIFIAAIKVIMKSLILPFLSPAQRAAHHLQRWYVITCDTLI